MVIDGLQQTRPDVDLINPDAVRRVLAEAAKNYVDMHTNLFSSYEGTLMPRPSLSVLQQTNMTFLQFLKIHDAEVLRPLFVCSVTSF